MREDIVSVLLLYRRKDVLTITTSWHGESALVIGQLRGCLGWLFGRKPDAQALLVIEEIKLLVDEVVLSDTERFKNPTWITEVEFPGVAQNFVIPE